MEENKETQKISANSLLDQIIAKTYTRHAKLSEQEFLEKLGLNKTDKTEKEVMDIAMFNCLITLTKQILDIKTDAEIIRKIINTIK